VGAALRAQPREHLVDLESHEPAYAHVREAERDPSIDRAL
jgi:hypothetical protein